MAKSAQIDTVPHGVEEYRALREASPWHELVSMVHISHGMKEPISPHLRSECAIIAGLAQATLPASKTPWQRSMILICKYTRADRRAAPGT